MPPIKHFSEADRPDNWGSMTKKERACFYQKMYALKNPEKILEMRRQVYMRHRDEIKRKSAEYARNNKDKVRACRRAYEQKRRLNDPSFRITLNMRHRLQLAINAAKAHKSVGTLSLVGCDPSTLKSYIESKFKPGMTWENYGKWHIDHIRPCASFDLMNEDEQKACFHYTNLQPLWAFENQSKGDKYNG